MANSAGMLKESIWRDKDFRALPRTAQATYAQLISQKELDRAGMQPLQIGKWVKGCDAMTESDFRTDLKVLEERRFVFVDEDTDELFIRSYMRHCDIVRYPNILKNALRCAGMVASVKLRHELAQELRRLHKSEAEWVADTIAPLNRSETVPEPIENRSETLPEPLPENGTVPEPFANPRDRDRDLDKDLDPLLVTSGEPPEKSGLKRPTPFCPKHMPDGTDAKCGACAGHRLATERFDARERARAAEAESEAAYQRAAADAQAIANCPMCDTDGYLPNRTVCSHDPAQASTNARGIAKARAALKAKTPPATEAEAPAEEPSDVA